MVLAGSGYQPGNLTPVAMQCLSLLDCEVTLEVHPFIVGSSTVKCENHMDRMGYSCRKISKQSKSFSPQKLLRCLICEDHSFAGKASIIGPGAKQF
jgi:hypothetical protein